MLNIVIPMAGAGSRFSREGYKIPKPLIPVNGMPMIQLVIRNLCPNRPHRFIFICQNEHIKSYELDILLPKLTSNCKIIGLNEITEGAACTVLKAREFINNREALMIANSDQYVDANINEYLQNMDDKGVDGSIMTMYADDPKWSFVGINTLGHVFRVEEKKVISNEATVGIYNFRHGYDFVKAAEKMITENLRVNNEFYVAPVYNQLIQQGHNISTFNIGNEFNGMYGLGTPEDLKKFLHSSISLKATKA